MIDSIVSNYIYSRTFDVAWFLFKIIDNHVFLSLHYGLHIIPLSDPDLFSKIDKAINDEKTLYGVNSNA